MVHVFQDNLHENILHLFLPRLCVTKSLYQIISKPNPRSEIRMRFSVTQSRCSFFILSDNSIFVHFGKIDDARKHWLQFLVGRIKEAVVISIIIAVACCLHAGQSFLYFGGGHVEDALTCFVRVVVGTMDEANIMQQQEQRKHSRKHQMTETGKTLE